MIFKHSHQELLIKKDCNIVTVLFHNYLNNQCLNTQSSEGGINQPEPVIKQKLQSNRQ